MRVLPPTQAIDPLIGDTIANKVIYKNYEICFLNIIKILYIKTVS